MNNIKIVLLFFCAIALLFITGCDDGGGGSMAPGMDKLKRRGVSRGKNYGRRFLRKRVKNWMRTRPSDKLEDQLVKDDWEVIGFEPGWTITDRAKTYEAHYYNLLSTLVVGGYDLNPRTGETRSEEFMNAPLNSGIVKLAREKNENLKILYSVSHYGDFGVDLLQQKRNFETFFKNQEVQGTLLENVNKMVDTLEADGIFVDFQNVPPSAIYSYIDFLKLARLKGGETLGEQYLIYMRLPSTEREQYFSDSTLLEMRQLADYFVIRGYDNYTTLRPEAIAPIYIKNKVFKERVNPEGNKILNTDGTPQIDTIIARGRDIDSLVNYYTGAGLRGKELIVELPMHGTVWKKSGENYIPEGELNKKPYRVINKIAKKQKQYPKDTSYASFHDVETNLHYFFEDELTLQKKFEWVENREIGGVGLWALGYNKYKSKEIWKSVAQVFSAPPVVLVPAILTYLSVFIFMSFIYSIVRYWQVRNFLNRKRAYLGYYVAGMIAIALLIFIVAYLLPRGNFGGIRVAGIAMFVFMLFPMLRKYFVSLRRWV